MVQGSCRVMASAAPADAATRVFIAGSGEVDAAVYAELYKLYRQLHDGFGAAAWSGSMANVMKELIAIRERQR